MRLEERSEGGGGEKGRAAGALGWLMAEMPPAEGQTPRKEGKYLLLPDERGTHSIIPSFMHRVLTPGSLLESEETEVGGRPLPQGSRRPSPQPPTMGSALFLPLPVLIMHPSGLCPTCLILTCKSQQPQSSGPPVTIPL